MLPRVYLPWHVSKNRMPTLALEEKRIKIRSRSLQACELYPTVKFNCLLATIQGYEECTILLNLGGLVLRVGGLSQNKDLDSCLNFVCRTYDSGSASWSY
jgi:hypothetical protein